MLIDLHVTTHRIAVFFFEVGNALWHQPPCLCRLLRLARVLPDTRTSAHAFLRDRRAVHLPSDPSHHQLFHLGNRARQKTSDRGSSRVSFDVFEILELCL